MTMVSQKKGADQRDAFRYAAPGACQEAILKFKRQDVSVALVDESAGGFAVRIGDPRPINAGDTLLLRTATGYSKVRVARVTQDSDGSSRTLGLQRLEDLGDDSQLRGSILSGLTRAVGGMLDSTTLLAATAIVILLVGGLWAATVLPGWSDEKPQGRTTSFGNRRVASWAPTGSSRQTTARSPRKTDTAKTPSRRWQKARAKADAASRSIPSRRYPTRRQLQQLLQTRATATLLSPEVIDELALTDEQRSALREIWKSSELFREESGSWVLNAPDQLDDSVRTQLAAIEKMALELLSESQRDRWSALRPSSPRGGDAPTTSTE